MTKIVQLEHPLPASRAVTDTLEVLGWVRVTVREAQAQIEYSRTLIDQSLALLASIGTAPRSK